MTDTGVGISEIDQQKLFQLFGKLSQTSNINANGIGLGLNICKKICEAFDGTIVVKSVQNEGSTFTFSMAVNQ